MLVSIKLTFRDVRFGFDSFSLRAVVKRSLFKSTCVSKIAQGGAETISRRREITPLTENVRYRGAIVRFETQKINVTLFAFIAL